VTLRKKVPGNVCLTSEKTPSGNIERRLKVPSEKLHSKRGGFDRGRSINQTIFRDRRIYRVSVRKHGIGIGELLPKRAKSRNIKEGRGCAPANNLNKAKGSLGTGLAKVGRLEINVK